MTSGAPEGRASLRAPSLVDPSHDYASRLPIGVLVLDTRQRVVHVDPRFVELFECDGAGLVGKSLEDLCSPRDRGVVMQLYRKMATSRGGMVEVLVRLRVGRQEEYARLRCVRSGAEWCLYVESAGQDGSLLFDLLVTRERWSAVYRSSPDGIVVLDREGRIVEHNPPFFGLMRFRSAHGVMLSEQALHGRALDELIEPGAFEPLRDALARLRAGAVEERTAVLHQRDAALEMRFRPMEFPGRGLVGACVTFRDVTRERELEDLRIKQGQAHFAGMAEVATNVLHNLGNIVGSVVYLAEELAASIAASKVESLERANGLLAERAARIVALFADDRKGALLPEYYGKLGAALAKENLSHRAQIADLLDRIRLIKDVIASQQAYARGAAFTEEVDLVAIVEEAAKIQNLALDRHGVEVVRRFDSVGPVRAQRSKLAHVMINLIKNAKEAMVEVPADARRLTLSVHEGDDGSVVVSVEDCGCGVAPEHLERIFAHGFTTKPEGSGFGLHFCATAVQEMGARLEVRSEGPGRGAAFDVRFPASLRARPG